MDSPIASDFEHLISNLAAAARRRGIDLMLIGGQAVLLHGVPRLTQDIDVTLGHTPDEIDRILDLCAELSLQPLPEDPVRFARDRYVLPSLHAETGVRVDLLFSSIPFERQALTRAVRVAIAGVDVPFAAVEDLILYKLFAGRPRDLEDIVGIVRRKDSAIDWTYVDRWVVEFSRLEGRENLPGQLDALRRSARL